MAAEPEKKPFFRSWTYAYVLVLGWLGLLIVALAVLTRMYE